MAGVPTTQDYGSVHNTIAPHTCTHTIQAGVHLLTIASHTQDLDSIQEEEDLSKQKAPDKPGRLPMPKSILDCFTGRYLYQVYNVWKQEAHRQHELANDHEE